MFPEFAAVYRDQNNKVHLYVFPGIDDDGNQLYRNIDLNSINVDYKFTKNKDKSFDYVFEKDLKRLTCTIVNKKTGEPKVFKFENI